jgi:hypothetical protein
MGSYQQPTGPNRQMEDKSMSQAKAIITINARPLSMLDAIAPNRERHTHNITKRTGALINTLAADLAAQGPVFPVVVYEPRNPYATVWGKIIDQPKFTAWEMARIAAQVAARKGGAL